MNKLINSVLLITCLFIVACSDDNIENTPTPFTLEKDYYEIRLERSSTSISITNGSGDISLDIENEDVLQAIYSKYNDDWEEDNLKGHINLYGMQKGVTTLTIIDNVTNDVEKVEVKVTDCYLAYTISESNYPALEANTTLFFINNQEKECYIFAIDKIHGRLSEQPIAKGSYEFFVTPDDALPQFNGIPGLYLNITDNDATTKSYDFQINANSSQVLSVIQAYLGVEWGKLFDSVHTKSPAPIDMTMKLTIPNTDYQITGMLSTTSIPEHILD